MPNEHMRTVHFHIGPDRVLEDLFRTVFSPVSDSINFLFVSDEDYKECLRDLIDGGLDEDIPEAIYELCSPAETVAISRPRLFFGGEPMNLQGGQGFYKLGTIQNGLKGYKVVFHLFLTGHLSYLARAAQVEWAKASEGHLSWIPFVKSISSQIANGNELVIWDAESHDFVESFTTAITGYSDQRLIELAKSTWQKEMARLPKVARQIAEKTGLDVEELKARFERDLEELGAM